MKKGRAARLRKPAPVLFVFVDLLLLWCPAIPRLRLEAVYVTGVDDMSTQDVFGYFKEYPPAHIEWIDDTSCK